MLIVHAITVDSLITLCAIIIPVKESRIGGRLPQTKYMRKGKFCLFITSFIVANLQLSGPSSGSSQKPLVEEYGISKTSLLSLKHFKNLKIKTKVVYSIDNLQEKIDLRLVKNKETFSSPLFSFSLTRSRFFAYFVLLSFPFSLLSIFEWFPVIITFICCKQYYLYNICIHLQDK